MSTKRTSKREQRVQSLADKWVHADKSRAHLDKGFREDLAKLVTLYLALGLTESAAVKSLQKEINNYA